MCEKGRKILMMIVYVPWERFFLWTENTISLELKIAKADYRSSKIMLLLTGPFLCIKL